MNAIRVKTHVDSETLVLPEIRPMIGRNVEIIVLDDDGYNVSKLESGGFADTAGKYPDIDEGAFLALREASKV